MASIKGYDTRSFSPYQDKHRAQFTKQVKSADGWPASFGYQDKDASNIINAMPNLDRGREYSIYNLVHNIKKDHDIKNLSDIFDAFYVPATDTIQNACINWVNPGTSSSNFYLTASVANGFGTFTPYLGLSCGSGNISTQLLGKNCVQYQQYSASAGVYLTYYDDVAQTAQGGGSYLLITSPFVTEIFTLPAISKIGWTINSTGVVVNNSCYNVPKGCLSVGINQANGATGGSVNSYFYINGYTMGTFYETPIGVTGGSVAFSMGKANNTVPCYGAYWVGSGLVDHGVMSRRLQEYMESLGIY